MVWLQSLYFSRYQGDISFWFWGHTPHGCLHSLTITITVQDLYSLLSSHLLSRNVKVKIYKTIILRVVLYGCDTWSLTLREDYRLRVFENRVLRRIFGPKRDEVTGEWRKLHNEDFLICTHPDISLGRWSEGKWGGRGMWHTWERTKSCTRFWC
jgi:hypothetical protein